MRSDLNNVTIEGNAASDSKTSVAKNGSTVMYFPLANNRYVGETKTVCFIDVVAFGKVADSVGQITKGEKIVIIGELKQNSWESDGKKNTKHEIVAHTILFKDYSKGGEESKGNGDPGDDVPY